MTPHKKERIDNLIVRYLLLFIGASLVAISIELFLVPNRIIDGGVIGISLLLTHLTGIGFGILVLAINLPFLLAGYRRLGKRFVKSSLFSILVLSIEEKFLQQFHPITDEPLLATVFGGLLLGTGVGIVIRNAGALDGTEILGILLMRKMPFSVGEFVMFINIFIFGWAGFILGWEQAMLSILTYYIASKTIDAVGKGILNETKAALIVSNSPDIIASQVEELLRLDVTVIYGEKKGKDTRVLYVVIPRLEIAKLKQIVFKHDPFAFTAIMDTQEVHGARFRKSAH